MSVTESPNLGLTWGWEEGESGWGGPVNFNWLILDVVTNALALSATTKEPPTGAVDGDAYIVPDDAEGEWETRRGTLACRITGDWHYFIPRKGWYFRVEDAGLSLMFDGQFWTRYDGDKGDKGDTGAPPLLRRTDTEIQWTVPGGNWVTLVPLVDIKGDTGDVTPELLQARDDAQEAALLAAGHLSDVEDAKGVAVNAAQTAINNATQTGEDRDAVELDRSVAEGSAIIAQQNREAAEDAADIAATKSQEAFNSAEAASQSASDADGSRIAAEQHKDDAEGAAGTATSQAGIAVGAAGNAGISATFAGKTVPVYSDTPPEDPIPGARWTDAETGRSFEWIVDQDSSQWVEVGAVSTAGFDIKQAAETAILKAGEAKASEIIATNAAGMASNYADAAEQSAQDAADIVIGGAFADESVSSIQGWTSQKISEELSQKQDSLDSGENIKTIGGQSILGSGDLALPESFKTGDILTTARSLSAPDWLPATGGAYLRATYPDLAELLPQSLNKLPDPAVLPAGTARSAAFSPDGNYLAVGHSSSPCITIYKRSGDTFTKLPDPVVLPVGDSNSVAFSPDGNYLAVGHNSSPCITIYKRSGDTFTKLPSPAVLPVEYSNSVAFSPDGNYLAVGQAFSPYIIIYKRSGDTFTKLPDPAVLPASTVHSVAFSPDGNYLAVTPRIIIYKRSGDTFTKLPDPAVLPAGTARSAAFSPDGNYLAVGNSNSPRITMYKRSGDTFTKLPDLAGLPAGNVNSVAFSPDGNYFAFGCGSSPHITIYKRNGDTFEPLYNPVDLPPFGAWCVAFSPGGNYLAVGHSGSPYIMVYTDIGAPGSPTHLVTPSFDPQDRVRAYIKT